MKIGIMTWHDGFNYGTILQSFSLQYFIKHRYDCEVELIDYKQNAQDIEKKVFWYKIDGLLAKIRVKLNRKKEQAIAQRLRKEYAIQFKEKERNTKRFKELIPLSKKVTTEEELMSLEYDVYICGSDQIWNPTIFNKKYYLNFVKEGKRKISYAPSMGTESLPRYMHSLYRSCLSDFHSISTREKASSIYLSSVLGRDVQYVIDPTLLLERKTWLSLSEYSLQQKDSRYVLCYFLTDNNSYYREVEKFANEKNLKIISLVIGNSSGYNIKGAEINISSGPFEFLALIKNAEYVITNSFHCCVFSIIFQREFYVYSVNLKSSMADVDFRYKDFLGQIGLQNRYIGKSLYMCLDKISPINWGYVDAVINQMRNSSIRYLDNAILNTSL